MSLSVVVVVVAIDIGGQLNCSVNRRQLMGFGHAAQSSRTDSLGGRVSDGRHHGPVGSNWVCVHVQRALYGLFDGLKRT